MNLLTNFNAADVVVVLIMLIGMIIGMYRGLLVSFLKIFSTAASIVITTTITPIAAAAVRKTFVYTMIYNSVKSKLGLSTDMAVNKPQQSQIIEGLNVPGFLKSILLENNNNVVYELLNVKTFNEYIFAYIANIITQIVIFAVIFLVILFFVFAVMHFMKVLCKIPVIKQCNAVGGGIIGIIYSVLFIWTAFAVLNIFILNPGFEEMLNLIKSSVVASFLYDHDFLLQMLLGTR